MIFNGIVFLAWFWECSFKRCFSGQTNQQGNVAIGRILEIADTQQIIYSHLFI